jgi:hypothetical protein
MLRNFKEQYTLTDIQSYLGGTHTISRQISWQLRQKLSETFLKFSERIHFHQPHDLRLIIDISRATCFGLFMYIPLEKTRLSGMLHHIDLKWLPQQNLSTRDDMPHNFNLHQQVCKKSPNVNVNCDKKCQHTKPKH